MNKAASRVAIGIVVETGVEIAVEAEVVAEIESIGIPTGVVTILDEAAVGVMIDIGVIRVEIVSATEVPQSVTLVCQK